MSIAQILLIPLLLVRKNTCVERRAGCFQQVDNVRTPSLWIRLKKAPSSPFVRKFYRVHSCSTKNLVAHPVGV
jgi:hypothetical protein